MSVMNRKVTLRLAVMPTCDGWCLLVSGSSFTVHSAVRLGKKLRSVGGGPQRTVTDSPTKAEMAGWNTNGVGP